ncbi:MAG: class I SAM-dependent methyltransferase [Candidatus Saccharibacteria bacterium]
MTTGWEDKEWHDLTEEDILQANIKKYEDESVVGHYDDEAQESYDYLEQDTIFPVLTRYLGENKGSTLNAIDVCGGAGRAAFTLHRAGGCNVTLLDTSEKMLEIAQRTIDKHKIENVTLVQEDALAYLRDGKEQFDIIAFSSAIHHFKDPFNLVQLAYDRLSPDGVMVIVGEPNTLISSKKYKRVVGFYAVLTSPDYRKQFIQSIPERFKGKYVAPDYREVAEYHAHIGIDDTALRKQMDNAGMSVLLHIRYPAGPRIATRILPLLGLNWVMGMVVGKKSDPELSSQLKTAISEEIPYKVDII